jgi:hypothetical protein
LPAEVLAKLGGAVTDSGAPNIPSIGGASTPSGANAAADKPSSSVLDSPAVGVKSLTDQITALLSGAKGGNQ